MTELGPKHQLLTEAGVVVREVVGLHAVEVGARRAVQVVDGGAARLLGRSVREVAVLRARRHRLRLVHADAPRHGRGADLGPRGVAQFAAETKCNASS